MEGFVERGIHLVGGAREVQRLVELIGELVDELEGCGEALVRASHAAVLPHDVAKEAVEVIWCCVGCRWGVGVGVAEELVYAVSGFLTGLCEGRGVGGGGAVVYMVGEVVL